MVVADSALSGYPPLIWFLWRPTAIHLDFFTKAGRGNDWAQQRGSARRRTQLMSSHLTLFSLFLLAALRKLDGLLTADAGLRL